MAEFLYLNYMRTLSDTSTHRYRSLSLYCTLGDINLLAAFALIISGLFCRGDHAELLCPAPLAAVLVATTGCESFCAAFATRSITFPPDASANTAMSFDSWSMPLL